MAVLVVRCEPPTGYLRTRCQRQRRGTRQLVRCRREQKTRVVHVLRPTAGGVPNCCDAFRIGVAFPATTKVVYHAV
jgi:hypothetical protein